MTTVHDEPTDTLAEVAAWLRCGRRKVAAVARANGIGIYLGGSAGWRFTAADRVALKRALAPAPPPAQTVQQRRPRRGRR